MYVLMRVYVQECAMHAWVYAQARQQCEVSSLVAPHFVFRERVSVNPELIERISKVWTEGRCFMKLLFLN